MAANSTLLFLLNDESHRQDEGRDSETLGSDDSHVGVVEAGLLSVRLLPGSTKRMPRNSKSYSPQLVLEETEFPELERSRVEASLPLVPSGEPPLMGWKAHLLGMLGAACRIIAVLSCIGMALGICAFIIGVAIPFGLL